MVGSSLLGHMNYQVSRVGLRGKKMTSRCATGRGDTIGQSAGRFGLLGGPILEFLALKVQIEKGISSRAWRERKFRREREFFFFGFE